MKNILLIFLSLIFTFQCSAQCKTFADLEDSEEIEEACVLYRDHLKNNSVAKAFSYWIKVFESAPGTNGKVSFVISDGAEICSFMFEYEKDKSKKLKYCKFYQQVIDQQKICFPELKIPEMPLIMKKFYDKNYK